MTEPLTDEEFESVKNNLEIYKNQSCEKLANRLIATVDYWRCERQQTAKDAVSVIDRLQEENAKLRNELWFGPDRTELEEEIKKLRGMIEQGIGFGD